MRSSMSAAVVLLAALIPAGRPAVAAQNPVDTLVVCGVTTVSTAPSYTALGCAFNNSGATYDLAAGRFSVGAIGSGAEAALIAEDTFKLSGPGSTKPIPFSAQLAVHVASMWFGYATAGIRSDDQTQAFTSPLSLPGGSFYQTLTMPLSHVMGERFHLAVDLHAFSPGGRGDNSTSQATASVTLTFVLPPDYILTSDQGYSSIPTATSVSTWGRLKTIYR